MAAEKNMCPLISKYGVVGIRLAEPNRSAKYDAKTFRAYPAWPPNKEYVAVPVDLLKKTASLRPYLGQSFVYAKALKPKPTAKKKKT